MLDNDGLSILDCSMVNCSNKIKHIAEDPIVMQCLCHFACRRCLSECGEEDAVCVLCSKLDECDLTKIQDLGNFKNIMNENLNGIFEIIRERFENSIDTYKEYDAGLDEKVELKIQFVKEDVEIRIESLKIQLDTFYEKFLKQLDDYKSKWQLWKKNTVENLTNINTTILDTQLNELNNDISNKVNLTEEALYSYQNKIEYLNKCLNELKNIYVLVDFEVSARSITEDLIGNVSVNFLHDNNSLSDDIMKKVRFGKSDGIQLGVNASLSDACVLNNGNILMASLEEHSMILLDVTNNDCKIIQEVDNQLIWPYSIAVNRNHEIYFSDYKMSKIYKIDENFNILAIFGSECGSHIYQLNRPLGINYYNNSLYICDSLNRRIQVLTSDLSYRNSFHMDYVPWYIRVTNSTACVRPKDVAAIYFYDSRNFIVKQVYGDHNGIIGIVNSKFYEYYPPTRRMYCYEENGDFIEYTQTDVFCEIGKNDEVGAMVEFNSNLLMTTFKSNKLIVLSQFVW